MFHSIIILLLIFLHVFSDFYLNKEDYHLEDGLVLKRIISSFIIYSVTVSIIINILIKKRAIMVLAIILGIHFAVRGITLLVKWLAIRLQDKTVGEKLSNFIQKGYLYLTDQILHIALLIIITEVFLPQINITRYFRMDEEMLQRFMLYTKDALIFCLIFRPVNMTFQRLFSHTKPVPIEDDQLADVKTGKLIGNLERVLVYLLLLVNQYAAIGFVFAAKSITRYERISKDRAFAEYYLLGTLFSIISVLMIIRGVSYITAGYNFFF